MHFRGFSQYLHPDAEIVPWNATVAEATLNKPQINKIHYYLLTKFNYTVLAHCVISARGFEKITKDKWYILTVALLSLFI
jgi:hypothetical protein